jgi:hypothetical protein
MEIQNNLTITERRLIQSLFRNKPAEYIASLIDKPLNLVNAEINDFSSKGEGRLSYDIKRHLAEVGKESKKKKDKSSKSLNPINKVLAYRQYDHVKSSFKKVSKKVFKTRLVDLSKKIRVSIDRKTTIYVDPNSDIEKIRRMYQKRAQTFLKPDNPIKYVTKFKLIK